MPDKSLKKEISSKWLLGTKSWCLTKVWKKEISSNWSMGKKFWCLTKVWIKKSRQIDRWAQSSDGWQKFEKRNLVKMTAGHKVLMLDKSLKKRNLVKLIDGQKVLTSDVWQVWIKKSRQIDRWAQSSNAWQKFEKRNLVKLIAGLKVLLPDKIRKKQNLFKLFVGKKGQVYYLRHLNKKSCYDVLR